MASSCHWVDELFPPRFNFDTPLDSDGVQYEAVRASKINNVQNIYDDVYSATNFQGKVQKLDTMTTTSLKPKKKCLELESDDSAFSFCDKINAESSQTVNKNVNDVAESESIWSKDELKVLRKSLKRSKLNNIRLSILTRSLQKDCEHFRNICQEQSREILKWNRKYNEVRKQNKRMKIISRAFKEDIKKYNMDLKERQELLEVAVSARDRSEMEFHKTKNALEVTQKELEILKSEFKNQKMMQDRKLENQKTSFEILHAKELYRLTSKLEETQLRLEKEQNDHTINKKALKQLQLHFASGNR